MHTRVKAVADVFLERIAILFSPLRRDGFLQNPDLLRFRTLRGRLGTLVWNRITRSDARGLLVGSMAFVMAVRFVDEVETSPRNGSVHTRGQGRSRDFFGKIAIL